MKRTISLIIAVVVMVSMFVIPVSAEDDTVSFYVTSPLDIVSLAEVTASTNVTTLSDISEGESVLQEDVAGELKITSGEYIIDLNGYTLAGRVIIEGGVVTIKDTSAAKTGKIDASQINDAIDVSGGANVSLENITVIGAYGSGDGIFVTGSANVSVKNCVITAGKAGIDNTSLSSVVIVEDTTFADFANIVPDGIKDGRNAAIEFRNNAKVVLRGDNKFEVNTIVCRTATHETSFAESFILGDNVTVTFEEDTDLGYFSEYQYTANKITYVFDESADEPVNEPEDEPADTPAGDENDVPANESEDEPNDEIDKTTGGEAKEDAPAISNPNTGDFMSLVVVIAAVIFAVTVITKKRVF